MREGNGEEKLQLPKLHIYETVVEFLNDNLWIISNSDKYALRILVQ